MNKELEDQKKDGVEGQDTKNELPSFEGISPEIVEALHREQPELFAADPAEGSETDAGESGSNVPEPGTEGAEGEADGDGGRPKQAEKTVPLAALQEERAKRKEMQERLERLENESREMARMQLEHARNMQAMQQQKTEPQPQREPDPLEALVDRRLGERLKPIEEQQRRTAAMQENEARITRFEAEAKKKYADYDEVVAPVMNWMTEQAKRAQSGDQQAAAGLGFVLDQANPAEAAYTLGIRLRYEQQQKAAQGNQGGAPAGSPAPANKIPTPAEQQAAAEKAQAAAQYPRGLDVPGGSGGRGAPVLSEASLATMTPDEWAKLPPETRSRLLKGRL